MSIFTLAKRPVLDAAFILSLAVPGLAAAQPDEKLYVALEGEGKIAVVDTQARKVIRQIDLTEEMHGTRIALAPHNIQVAPDGKSVWVTANAGHHGHGAELHGEGAPPADQIIVIDPVTDTVLQRIPIGPAVHLSHVVLTPDSRLALVNSQDGNRIYKIDASSFGILGSVEVPGQGPHGIRISPDGARAYLAMLLGKNLGVLDLSSEQIRYFPAGGGAVQAGVTPDGKTAMVSVYAPPGIALWHGDMDHTDFIPLPPEAKGPVQMYPTPDGRFVYLADQGHYFGQPVSESVYKIDLAEAKVVRNIKAGKAPHGVVVSKSGDTVYVTNLLSGDVSVIDAGRDEEVARIAVGEEPNGISLWWQSTGGTP